MAVMLRVGDESVDMDGEEGDEKKVGTHQVLMASHLEHKQYTEESLA